MTLALVADPDYELTYVATMLAMPELIDAHRLDASDIEAHAWRAAYEQILALRLSGQPVRSTALRLALEATGADASIVEKLRHATIDPDLGPIRARLKAAAECRRIAYAAVALAASAKRGDLAACREIAGRMQLAHDPSDDVAPVMSMREVCIATVEAIQAEGRLAGRLIMTGMPSVDACYRLAPGQLTVIGAATNVGKTTLAITWLLDMASRGIPCGVISVEDGREDFGAKILGALAKINPSRMWSGSLSHAEWLELGDKAMRYADAPLSVAVVQSRSVDDVLARLEYMARVRGARVVVVDYLQAIAHRDGPSIRERIDRTLEELIAAAGRLGVALVLCSQLTRPERGSPYREPTLIDLKESGSIENRAQCVVLLWRASDKPHEPISAKIAKAKRSAAGRRFALSRAEDTGMLRELDADDDGYRVGGWR